MCFMFIKGSEDAVTIQNGTFSWYRNEGPILEKCVYVVHMCVIYIYIIMCM